MDISFCIVNLNAKKHLHHCLNSIPFSLDNQTYEILIADNNSSDGSQNYIQNFHPYVSLFCNPINDGYTKAMNKLLNISKGNFKVILNPDAELMPDSISILLQYFKSNDFIGILGPKVINEDGSFQKSCRRGLARPSAVFSYFLGLSKLYPKNKKYTGYHLNHLDENEINRVSGVSGSCMVIRKHVIDDVGCFDERFFAYQEDSDFCLRAINKGWQVYYNPKAIVKHIGGKGGANSVPSKARFEWHRSYIRYYFKHFSNEHSSIFNYIYFIIMVCKLIMNQIKYLLSR